MPELTWGGIGRTIQLGINPRDLTLQVIGSKPIGEQPSHDGEHKYRVALWDGLQEYKHGLLSSRLIRPPPNYSIIRVGTAVTAAGKREPQVRKVMQKGEEVFAYIFEHYELVAEVTSGLERRLVPSSDAGSSADLLSPPSTQGGSHMVNGTPEQPPALLRVPGRASCQPAVPTANRESVKRNLEADFPPGPPTFKKQTSNNGGPVAVTATLTSNGGSTSNGASGSGNRVANVRNGAISAGADGTATHEVAVLNPFINKYIIKVRVSKKSAIKQIATSRWSGTVADCILSDSSGDIKLTGFDSNANSISTLLQEGSTYLISGAKVQAVRDSRFNTTGHLYELNWNQYTQATGPILSSQVSFNYKFIPIDEIRSLEKGKSCDVCAWVQEVGNYVEFRSRADKELKKRELQLADDSESSISLTLWGDLAKDFTHQHRVLAVRGATVGEFNGVKNLSLGFSGSYEVEPDLERVKQLLRWSSSLSDGSFSSQLPPSQLSARNEGDVLMSVEELRQEVVARRGGEVRARMAAYILQIMDDSIAYRAHFPADGTWCRRKVVESREENLWTCHKCNKRDIPECDTQLRYNVRMCVGDATSTAWCNMFDADSLFQKNAQEMTDLKVDDYNSFKTIISSLLMERLVLCVVAKTETFNDSAKLKVTVQEVKRIDWGGEKEAGPDRRPAVGWKELVGWQLDEVRRLQAQLGVNPQLEYGITWSSDLDK